MNKLHTILLTLVVGVIALAHLTAVDATWLPPIVTLNNVQDETCGPNNNGAIELFVTNAQVPFTIAYAASGGPVSTISSSTTLNTIPNLSAGTYSLTVTDANNEVTTLPDFAVVQQTPPISASIGNVEPSLCFSPGSGSIEVNLTGGTAPYAISYTLNGVTTTITTATLDNTIGPIVGGTYTIDVIDAVGCTPDAPLPPVFVDSPDAPLTASLAPQNTSGQDYQQDGFVDVCVNGGTPPYSIDFGGAVGTVLANGPTDDCQASFTVGGLAPGNYPLNVIDANGCEIGTQLVTIPDSSCLDLIMIAASGIPESCAGANDGGANITFFEDQEEGLVATIHFVGEAGTFVVDTGLTELQLELTGLLPPGQYHVIATDTNGCQVQFIDGPISVGAAPVEFISAEVTNATDSVSADGTVFLCFSGTGSYSYEVTPDVGVPDTIAGFCDLNIQFDSLPPGEYTVTATSGVGCQSEINFVVSTQVECGNVALALNTADTILCAGDTTGTATFTVLNSDGTDTFNVSFDGGLTFDTTDYTGDSFTVTGFFADSFNLVFAYGESCLLSFPQYVIIRENDPIDIDPTPFYNQQNGGSSGSIDLCVSGGIAPYTMTYSPAVGSQMMLPGGGAGCTEQYEITGLPAGTYTITVEDAEGCIRTREVEILEPTCPGFTLEMVATNLSCFGDLNSGYIDLDVTGGSGPYTYDIISPEGYQSFTTSSDTFRFSGLDTGQYYIAVTDASGCFVPYFAPIDILEPEVMQTEYIIIPPCPDEANGVVCIVPDGGTPGYRGESDAGDVLQGPGACGGLLHIDMVESGTYYFVLEDTLNCRASNQFTLDAVAPMLSASATDVCEGETNGTATASASGSTEPYTYEWSTGATTEAITNLSPGDYTVTVTDSRGCTAEETVTVEEFVFDLELDVTDVCGAATNGAILLTIDGPAASYQIEWSTGDVGVQELLGLGAGTYSVTVTADIGNGNLCVETATATLVSNPVPTVDAGEDVTIKEGTETTLVADVDAAVNFAVSWSPTTGLSDPTDEVTDAAPPSTTTYTISVVDDNGCTAQDDVTVTVIEDFTVVVPTGFTPNGDGENDTFFPFSPDLVEDFVTFEVYNRWGEQVHDDPSGEWDGTIDGTPQPTGAYVWVVEYVDILGETQQLKGHVNLIR